MSFKTLFNKATQVSSLANKSAADIGNEVESVEYHQQDIIHEKRFIPNIDLSDPAKFARYGSAEEYYKQSVERVYEAYPYDGSLKEKLEWENDSTYIDLHIFNNLYPRTNGYVIISADGWGDIDGAQWSGYGLPEDLEFIFFKGGPHPNPDGMAPIAGQFTGSNYYNVSNNRENNLKYDLQNNGVTVEFWLKKDSFDTTKTEKEIIFDLWNGEQEGTSDYGRLTIELSGTVTGADPFLVTAQSGSSAGVIRASVASTSFTTSSIADGKWHHYAVSLQSASAGTKSRFYVDGNLNNTITTGSSGLNEVLGGLRAYIGAAITTPAATAAPAKSGKLSGSLDEFRYWKTRRSSKDIGRYWFDQVGGGTNSDPEPFTDTQETVNTNLGVYFKFNEGITGVTATDSTVLDYSGRISNGTWTGYGAGSRETGSAIVLSNAATKEFKDPIIYSTHPKVVSLQSQLQFTGSEHDATNNASIYNSIPSWITEEDAEQQYNVRYLTQIMGSYFDTLHMQMDAVNDLKDIRYVSGSDKPIPFSHKLLSSCGFVSPNIFVDADILEKLADRSEDLLYEKSLNDTKNIIYQNIYNNLAYIYKSKGTEKAFRNLIRCFGIDDELIKLNMYAKNTAYEYRLNRRSVLVNDRVANFNTPQNKSAVVFSFSSSLNPNSTGFISSDSVLNRGFAFTLESDIILPSKPDETSTTYFNTNTISSSLFGLHGAGLSEADTSWPANDGVNFQVYAVRDEIDSPNVKFVLTGTAGGYVPRLESTLYEGAYDKTRWNLSVRIKPENYPLAYFSDDAANGNYTVVLAGHQVEGGELVDSFEVSGTVSAAPSSFITGSRRVYVGAHRTNVTGAVLQTSDVEVDACRFWLDYVDNEALKQHVLDPNNFGALAPAAYAFPFDATASYGDVKKADTLALNWEFSQNTGSNALGQFLVADESSGSLNNAATRYGPLGPILNMQYTGQGYDFKASSTAAIKKEFIVASRLNDLESIAPAETIQVLGADEQQVFKIDSRPVNYFFAFEKSTSKVISEEMVNMFGTLRDFNNMIGLPVNRYRQEYKTLNFMRQKFFEKVENNEIDFDRFYEFYKWFDSSLSYMLGQLVPAAADFAENIRTTIENTTLQRSKYKNIFPFIDALDNVFETSLSSNVDYGDAISSPDDDPQGTGFYPVHAPRIRQVGLSARAVTKRWKYNHAPEDGDEKKKYLWWKNKAARDNPTISVNEDVNASRSTVLKTIRSQTEREMMRPYRYSAAGATVLGGVGAKQNKNVNFMFAATNPYGPLLEASNIPQNIMLSFDSDVENLLDTTDEFYPTYKQRLGYGINPRINHDTDIIDKRDGNNVTTFSLYKIGSPVSKYEEDIADQYKPGVTITNLHHDYVDSTDIPLQGPFTEKFVGGRQFRHTEINPGSDSRTTRFEGYRLALGMYSTASHSGSLGIVPPNYPFADSPAGSAPNGFLPELAVRSRFRDETAKRPVNIKNILMTTEPLGTRLSGVLHHNRIGNYSHNYEVLNTAGRVNNDPFFNDQSFDFAPYPETLATRGRFPLYLPLVSSWEPKTIHFAEDDDYVDAGSQSAWDASDMLGAEDRVSISFWFRFTNETVDDHEVIFSLGKYSGSGNKDSLTILLTSPSSKDNRVWAIFQDNAGYQTSVTSLTAIDKDTWYHAVIVFPEDSMNQGPGSHPSDPFPRVYINGSDDSGTADNQALWGDDFISGCRLGESVVAVAGFENYRGYLADLAIWDSELSDSNAVTLYNDGTRVDIESTGISGLKSWWKLGSHIDDSATGTLYNEIAGGIDITPDGFDSTGLQEESPPTPPSWYPFYGDPLYEPTANPGGNLNYALPSRTGSNSNHTVFVNRYAGSGYEVMSRGYMDPAHEELSVYNALPYHNLSIRNHGLSGNVVADPIAARTITVIDQIGKNRGLDQRASLHCGPFGSDGAFGSVPELTYVTIPSWHKTNRNAKARILSSSTGYTQGVLYDNLYVQHALPRSEQQYAWVTASLKAGATIFGLDAPACLTASSMSQLIVSGATDDDMFVPVNIHLADPVSASSHTLGYPLAASAQTTYPNPSYWFAPVFVDAEDYFNALMLTRNGPYQYPTWKQIRTGEGKVASKLRRTNTIGTVIKPAAIPQKIGGRTVQFVNPRQANQFVDYIEQPISSRYYPVTVCLEDNTDDSNTDNNILLNVTYANLFDYFSNEGLNNYLGTPEPDLYNNALNTVFEYVTSSNMSVVIGYSERIYPAEINAYKNIVRRRTEFTIDDIWNPNRTLRSELDPADGPGRARPNSQGASVLSASIWPLDGRKDFGGPLVYGPASPASQFPLESGSISSQGELMNMYSRLSQSYNVAAPAGSPALPGATYAMRVPAGKLSDYSLWTAVAGDAKWQAAEQSGKQPYTTYEDYSEKIARVGKDHSIVPEFRISSLIEDYVETNQSNFLASLDNILELTGASIANSSQSQFFKTYTNSDFLKYFTVVDKEINNKRSGDLKIKRDKVALKCSALLKFLPYKGFYPAERTVELATLFSRSYGDSFDITTDNVQNQGPAMRAILEPFYAPGIMFNTIKSGIAVNNWVMVNSDTSFTESVPYIHGNSTELPEGDIWWPYVLGLGSGSSGDSNKYAIQKIPFEAIYQPTKYFNTNYITSSYIYDTGTPGAQSLAAGSQIEEDPCPPRIRAHIRGKKLYELAADNFLCETVEFFKDGLSSFVSDREDKFNTVRKDQEYKMTMTMYRTTDSTGSVDRNAFEMYSRTSAFGAPVVKNYNPSYRSLEPDAASASFSHVTPPYFAASGSATFTYKAQYTGVPTLDEILANTTISYTRAETVNLDVSADWPHGLDPRIQLDSCFNLTDYYSEVPRGTVEQKKRWLIQSKFETPILNFAGVDVATPRTTSASAGTSSADQILTRGMWHQYGSIPAGSNLGVFAVMEDSVGGRSLADVVNIQTGIPARIGSVKTENTLEEAVIAVPFKTIKNRRKFFEFDKKSKESDTYKNLKGLMDKYVFPPKFDFTRHKTVKAVQMYAFEFSADVTQQDISDMWQNLPPDIADRFEQKEVFVEEEELIKSLVEKAGNIQWMVFKVKKRAKKDYEKYRRSLVTSNTGPFVKTIGDYSYNWPYDYFSLVELVKIDETVQYVSTDLTEAPDSTIQVVGTVNVDIANPVPVDIVAPEGFDG